MFICEKNSDQKSLVSGSKSGSNLNLDFGLSSFGLHLYRVLTPGFELGCMSMGTSKTVVKLYFYFEQGLSDWFQIIRYKISIKR